jgi:hypothetical protein
VAPEVVVYRQGSLEEQEAPLVVARVPQVVQPAAVASRSYRVVRVVLAQAEEPVGHPVLTPATIADQTVVLVHSPVVVAQAAQVTGQLVLIIPVVVEAEVVVIHPQPMVPASLLVVRYR